jgi:hypothetical protein
MFINGHTDEIITPEKHRSIMMLIKILFRLNIIKAEQALKIASQFRILFV